MLNQETTVSNPKPLATIPANADPAARAKAIADAAAKRKAQQPNPAPATPAKPPAPAKPATPTPTKPVADKSGDAKPEKKPVDPDLLTVSDVARAIGIDPKHARARLRASGKAAVEGRWAKVKRGSKEYDEVVSIIKPPDDSKPVADKPST